MNSKIKLGLIGCGRAAELIYVPALRKFQDINVAAVVDPASERRKLITGNFKNCYGYPTINQDFINQIDAAIICSPPDTHISIASKLLENNKYVLVEKPLALSLDGIEELKKIELESNASLMMGFNHRNWKPVTTLKQELSKGLNIFSGSIVFSGNYHLWNPVSFKTNALNDLGPHVFDLVRYIFDKQVISSSTFLSDKNKFKVKIKLEKDILVDCVIMHSNKNEKSINIKTETGNFFIKLGSTRIQPEDSLKRNIYDFTDNLKNKLLRKTSPIKESFEIQLRTFFNLARGNKNIVPGIEDGIFGILASKAAVKSLNENGRQIYLNEIS